MILFVGIFVAVVFAAASVAFVPLEQRNSKRTGEFFVRTKPLPGWMHSGTDWFVDKFFLTPEEIADKKKEQ